MRIKREPAMRNRRAFGEFFKGDTLENKNKRKREATGAKGDMAINLVYYTITIYLLFDELQGF